MATLWKVHQRSTDSAQLVERALRDQLGEDYRTRMSESPVEATRPKLPTLPTRQVRKRSVDAGHIQYSEFGQRTTDQKRAVEGKRVSVRVDRGGRRLNKKN